MIEERVFELSSPAGEYRDILTDAAGTVIWETPWQSNVIVDSLRKLLAALMKGDSQGTPIAFWAVGIGEDTWDSDKPPADEARRNLTQLFKETGRKAIPPEQITFLDGTFTNRLQITTEFKTADIPGGAANCKLREFGIFAGGTTDANSGTLINHRTHSRIDLQEGFTLNRTLNLTF